jgi:hypothetical protein
MSPIKRRIYNPRKVSMFCLVGWHDWKIKNVFIHGNYIDVWMCIRCGKIK